MRKEYTELKDKKKWLMLLYSLFIISIFYNIKSIISDLNIVYDI